MKRLLAAALLLPLLGLAGCGDDATAKTDGATLRLGYFANLTHATPNIGVEKGFLAEQLGTTTLKTQVFNAGPPAVEALLAGSLDAAYIGPNPAINAFTKSNGEAIRIVAGATSGGAYLVVKPEITSPSQLKGKTIASPSKGNTQDVALRAWLGKQGFPTTLSGRGDDVLVAPTENAVTLEEFSKPDGGIDGAWVPEPWATRLVQARGKVLVDEKSLWPDGLYVTTHLIVRTKYLREHPDVVKKLLEGHVATNAWIDANDTEAKTLVNAAIEKLTSKALKVEVIDAAWPNLLVTNDPIAASLLKSAQDAKALGLVSTDALKGIYDLTLLNEVLTAAGQATVSDAGLGG